MRQELKAANGSSPPVVGGNLSRQFLIEANTSRLLIFYQLTKGNYWILRVFESLWFLDSKDNGISRLRP